MPAPFSITEVKALRGSLLLVFLALILGSSAITLSLGYEKSALADHQKIKIEQQDLTHKLTRFHSENKELRGIIAHYQALVARGIIGQEHRGEWVEKIREIRQVRKLLDIQYELSPQHIIDNSIVLAQGPGFDVMTSPMKLQMQLLHEDDLLDLLTDLQEETQAFIRPSQCSLRRLTIAAEEQATRALLTAECQLDWITIKEKL